MEVIRVGLFLEDRIFAEALASALARECCSMQFYLLHCLEEGVSCDLILSSVEGADCRIVEMVCSPEIESRDRPPYRIFRYKDSQKMTKDLLLIYYQLTGKVVEHRGNLRCRVVAFFSGSGGCGTTSTALAVGRCLYQIYGARSLYLNLCPFNDSRKYLNETGKGNLLKLLYYLEQKKDFPLSSFIVQEEELDFVDTGVMNSCFDELSPLLLEHFLEKVDQLATYDFLIADLGNHLSKGNKKLLGRADSTVIVSDGERKIPGKYQEIIFREIQSQIEIRKLIKVENFAADAWVESERDVFCISKQPDQDLRLLKNYGIEIGAIAREIMEE